MKVNLVVAQGVHSGKVIPISTDQFLIGRDPHCNLRPASPAISKQHCGIIVKGDKVIIKDYGSTNGTSVNGEVLKGEREAANDDKLKIGPLEFVIRIDLAAQSTTTIKSTKPLAAPVAAPASTEIVNRSSAGAAVADHDEHENAAAMLLAMDDGSNATAEGSVPDGATVMDIPSMPGAAEAKPPEPPKPPADTSKTAADLLSKYMRRPRMEPPK